VLVTQEPSPRIGTSRSARQHGVLDRRAHAFFAAPLSGQRTGATFAAVSVAFGGGATDVLRHEGVPLYFGFLEFDWEPGRIPGFGPLQQAPR
jgi:hypothetical protein